MTTREDSELAQLRALMAARKEAASLQAEHDARARAARAKQPPRILPPRGPSPGLPRARMCNPRSYVVSADLYELGRELVKSNAAELDRKAVRGELSPTAICIAAVLYVFRGLRGGRDGCGVQAALDGAWAHVLGRSRRQVAYAFAQLEEAGWVARRRRLVRHEWTDEAGHTWQRADTHGAAYLLPKGAVQLQPAAWRKDGRRVVIGVVGKLLKLAAQKLRVLARRVTDAVNRCTPSFGEKRDKSFRTRGNARHQGARSTDPPGRRADAPGSRLPTKAARADEHQEDSARSAPRPQGKGLNAQQLYPELWAASDQRGRNWLLAQTLGVQLPANGASAKLRAARRAWVRRNAARRR